MARPNRGTNSDSFYVILFKINTKKLKEIGIKIWFTTDADATTNEQTELETTNR